MATTALDGGEPSTLEVLWARLRQGALANLVRAVRSNRKATAGFILLLIFCFLAAFPGVIAHDDPNAEIYLPTLGPSSAHLLGTTQYGQDIFAQLIYSTRESLVIAVAAGGLATVLSVLVGVTSAYIGGLFDDTTSLVTDIFLVIPAFPLIVVIAAYAKNGGDVILIAVLVVTGWAYGAAPVAGAGAVAPPPRFSRCGPAQRRTSLADYRVRDTPDHDVAHRGHIPRHYRVRHCCCGRPPVRRARQPLHPVLGHHALLGAKRRGPAGWVPPLGHHARGLHRPARGGVRPFELCL